MTHPFDDMLVCDCQLPLQWEKLQEQPAQSVSVQAMRNERLLHLLNAIEESPKESTEEGQESGSSLARVEAKLDLLLDLVGDMLHEGDPQWPASPVRLSARGIEWSARGEADIQDGDRVQMSLWLDPRLPRPVRLLTEVVTVKPDQEGGVRILGRFQGNPMQVEDLLGRAIFRYHRRHIASLRAQR